MDGVELRTDGEKNVGKLYLNNTELTKMGGFTGVGVRDFLLLQQLLIGCELER